MKDLAAGLLAPVAIGDEVSDSFTFSAVEFRENESRVYLRFTPTALQVAVEPRSARPSFQQTASFNIFCPSEGPSTLTPAEMKLLRRVVSLLEENDPGDVLWTTASTLYLAPGVICNPFDISLRAIQVLRQVAVVVVEPGKEAITAELLSMHRAGSAGQRIVALPDSAAENLEFLQQLVARHEDACLFGADEGIPGFSDPGKLLLAAAERLGDSVRVRTVGGTSALAMALLRVPIDLDQFIFVGVLSDGGPILESLIKQAHDRALITFLADERDAVMRRIARVCGPLDRDIYLACNLTCDDERLVHVRAGCDLSTVAPLTERDRVVMVVGVPGRRA